VTWTDSSTNKEFWKMAYAIGDLLLTQMLTVTLKNGTVARGTFAGSNIQGNSKPPTGWKGTLMLVIPPETEFVQIDFLDIQSLEIDTQPAA
jgi:hypothetical protein